MLFHDDVLLVCVYIMNISTSYHCKQNYIHMQIRYTKLINQKHFLEDYHFLKHSKYKTVAVA